MTTSSVRHLSGTWYPLAWHERDWQPKFPPILPCGQEYFRRDSMHSKLFTDMFVLAVPIAEKMLRPVIVYMFLVVGLRLAGKRELAQLNPFDLVVLLTLSNTVQNAIIGEDNSVTGGVIGAATLLIVNYLVVRFLYTHQELDQRIEGAPDVLVEDGKIRMDRLQKE